MAQQTIFRLPEVIRRTGLSRSSIYTRIKAGGFPHPVSLGARAVGWHSNLIDEWIASRPDTDRQVDKIRAMSQLVRRRASHYGNGRLPS